MISEWFTWAFIFVNNFFLILMINLIIQIIYQNLKWVILVIFVKSLPPKHGLIFLILINKINGCRLLYCAYITNTTILHISRKVSSVHSLCKVTHSVLFHIFIIVSWSFSCFFRIKFIIFLLLYSFKNLFVLQIIITYFLYR